MVAAIFAAHGLYWGNRQQQSAGYDTFENQQIKAILKQYFGLPFCTLPAIDEPNVPPCLRDIQGVTPSDRPWMMKTGIEYFHVFRPLNPFNVFIVRDPEAVVKSICDKRRNADPEMARKAAEWRYLQMKILHQQYGGVWVDTDRLIQGDFTQIREALEYCGVMFDEEKTKGAIRR